MSTCVVCFTPFDRDARSMGREIHCPHTGHAAGVSACRRCYQHNFDVTSDEYGVMRCCGCGEGWDRDMVARLIPEYIRSVKCIVPIDVERGYLADCGLAVYIRRIHDGIRAWINTGSVILVAGEDAVVADAAIGLVQLFQDIAPVYGTLDNRLPTLMTDARVRAVCELSGIALRGDAGGVGRYMIVGDSGVRDALVASCAETHVEFGRFAETCVRVRSYLRDRDVTLRTVYESVSDGVRRRIAREQDDGYQQALRGDGDIPDFDEGVRSGSLTVIRRCGHPDCNGVIGGEGCIMCGRQQCTACLGAYHGREVHECNKEDLASIKAAQASGRACPKCGVHIQRVSGCPTMFCVLCKTSFNYGSGVVYSGNPHNPHNPVWTGEMPVVVAAAAAAVYDAANPDVCIPADAIVDATRQVWLEVQTRTGPGMLKVAGKLANKMENLTSIGAKMLGRSVPDMLRRCSEPAHQGHLDRTMAGADPMLRLSRNFAARMHHLMNGTTDAAFVKETYQAYRKQEVEWRYAQLFREMDGAGLDLTRYVLGKLQIVLRDNGSRTEIEAVIEECIGVIDVSVAFFSERLEAIGRSYGRGIYRMALDGSGVVFTQLSTKGEVMVKEKKRKVVAV